MAANSQQFGIRQECPIKSVSEVKTSYDQRLDNLTSLVEKLVMGNTQQVKACGICLVVGHPTDMCPTLQDGSPEQMNVLWISRYQQFPTNYPKTTTHHKPSSSNSSMSLEDIVKTLATSTQQFQQDTKSTIQHLENQIGQLATSVNRLESQASGKFPFQTVNNPKQNVRAITLRSGKVLEEQTHKPSKRDLEKEIVKEGSTSQTDQLLLTMDQNMIDAASGGALVHKTPTDARTLISNMAANLQQFGTRQECPAKSVSEVKTSYDQCLNNLTALVEKLVMGNSTQQMKACGVCLVVGHPTDMCPTFQDGSPEQMNAVGGFPGPPQRKYDPFSNTYNPRWRDHPNFSYGSHIVKTLAISTQQFQQDTKTTIQNLENQIGQLAASVNRLESQALGKFPSQTVNNLKQNVSAVTLRSGKVLEEQPLKPSKRNLEKEIVKEGSTSQNDQPKETNSPQDEIKTLPPFPGRFAKSKKKSRRRKFLKLFANLRKLKGNEKVLLRENVSAMIQKKLPIKCKDPGMFTIPCKIGNVKIKRAMLDLRASINVMPHSIYESINVGKLKETRYPGNEYLVFSIDVIDSLVQKVCELNDEDSLKVALTNTISQSANKEFEPNLNLHEAISELNSLAPVNKRVSYIGFPLNNAKLLPSIMQAPKLELKKLPDHLKYLFLEEGDTLPVISSNKLTLLEDERLIWVLRDYKEAIGWTVADISGISPSICMHKIHLEEGATPAKQVQRRLNPPMMEVVSPIQVVPKKMGVTVIKNSDGFHQIPVALEDQEKTTFTCPFEDIIEPLCKLLQKDVVFEFNDDCKIAFDKLKELLTSSPIIQPPDWNLPFEIMSDARNYVVGAVLGSQGPTYEEGSKTKADKMDPSITRVQSGIQDKKVEIKSLSTDKIFKVNGHRLKPFYEGYQVCNGGNGFGTSNLCNLRQT
ncbi:uncharacterized protein Tco_0750517 [Tanacetum coccineum]|uniref:Reverse transcriptase/retrotransposon-derived protein RNase H-like domain-containing protein n=1 Tax=Tanacetum coccineum TaxID=301880 RepID=A0ABQ4Z2J7_9ASTR